MVPFRDPKVLPCGHIFCGPCVNQMTDFGGHVRCPKCNRRYAFQEVRSDHTLNKFCAVMDEQNAQIMAQHADIKAKTAELKVKDGEIVKLRKKLAEADFDVSPDSKCAVHRRRVIHRWCDDCQEWLCTDCCSEFHNNCTTKLIKEVDFRTVNQGMESKVRAVHSKLDELATKENFDALELKVDVQRQSFDRKLEQLKQEGDGRLQQVTFLFGFYTTCLAGFLFVCNLFVLFFSR